MLPLPMQDSLPAGWLAFAGRELNPLDRVERFPSCYISSPLPGFTLTLSAHDRGHEGTQARAPFTAQPHPQLQAVYRRGEGGAGVTRGAEAGGANRRGMGKGRGRGTRGAAG